MHVTGQPPSFEGMVIAPDVDVGIAALYDGSNTVALPPFRTYDHTIPSTTLV